MAEEADDLRGEIAKHLSDMEAPEAPVDEAPARGLSTTGASDGPLSA